MVTRNVRYWILIGICAVVTIAIALLPRFGQDPFYHQFADQRTLLSIPNALDVLTNLIFGWVGVAGLYHLTRGNTLHIEQQIYPVYFCFFLAVLLVTFGSGWYHWAPSNDTLIWDRIPLSVGTMSFFTILIAERISIALAKKLFPLLLFAGIASTVYWFVSELAGNGDLRPYALVQVLPMLLMPALLLLLRGTYNCSAYLWGFLACFLCARICEWLDIEIYNWLNIISGHSLKHIAAGIGCLLFLHYLKIRQPLRQ